MEAHHDQRAVEVLPGILEKDLDAIRQRVEFLRPHAPLFHLDVMDGQFVPQKTYLSAEGLDALPAQWEMHLMITKPEFFVRRFCLKNTRRVIVHFEAARNFFEVIRLIKAEGKEVAVAVNPETFVHEIQEVLPLVDTVTVMGVDPGASGQKLKSEVVGKVRELKRMDPKIRVEFDGGVNGSTRERLVKAGADILVSTSFLSGPEIAAHLKILREGR